MNDASLSGFDLSKRIMSERVTPAPDIVNQGSGTGELPPLIEITDDLKEQPYVEKKAKPDEVAAPKHFKSFSQVFLIWRSWETCKRCITGIDDGSLLIPPNGDLTCSHTQVVEYREVCDRCLSGHGILMSKEHFNIKRGDRFTHIEWLEGDPKKVREQRTKMDSKDRVYPPDPAKAFEDK